MKGQQIHALLSQEQPGTLGMRAGPRLGWDRSSWLGRAQLGRAWGAGGQRCCSIRGCWAGLQGHGQVQKPWGATKGQSGLPYALSRSSELGAASAPHGKMECEPGQGLVRRSSCEPLSHCVFPGGNGKNSSSVLPEPSSMETPTAGLKGGRLPMWVMHQLWHLQQIAQN